MSSNIDHEQAAVPSGAGWLAPHSGAYLAELSRLNYAARTIERHKCAVGAFIAQEERQFVVGEHERRITAARENQIAQLVAGMAHRALRMLVLHQPVPDTLLRRCRDTQQAQPSDLVDSVRHLPRRPHRPVQAPRPCRRTPRRQ